jgi:hypothetical protein
MKAESRSVFRDMIKRREDAIPLIEARLLEIGAENTRDPWEGHVAQMKRLETRLDRYRKEVKALKEAVSESSRYGH